MDRRIDISLSAIMIAVGIFVIIHATTIESGLYTDPIGPRAFFYGVGVIFILGGVINIAQKMAGWSRFPDNMLPSEGVDDEEGYPSSWKRAMTLGAICILYIVAFRPAGYLIATPIFIIASLRLLSERNWLFISAVGIIFTLSFYLIFAQGLGVWLPVGPFTDLFRDLGWITL